MAWETNDDDIGDILRGDLRLAPVATWTLWVSGGATVIYLGVWFLGGQSGG